MQTPVSLKDIVLVGGGHSHALVIRQWGMKPLPGVRVTLVSLDVLTPYSGMLPGLVAGHYCFDDVHIDLAKLCTWAGVRFIEARMTGIDLEQRQISLDARPALSFDVLSLDTGSTPNLSVPGAAEHSVPVKPVHTFHERWRSILSRVGGAAEPHQSAPATAADGGDTAVSMHSGANANESVRHRCLALGVVGSGAGGFELVAAMRHALPEAAAELHWFLRGAQPLSGRPVRVGQLARSAAEENGIVVHDQFDVAEVTSAGVRAVDGRFVRLDETLWCTGATGPAWPRAAGLAVDAQGFVATNEHLQSTSHPFVFASGDVGTQRQTPSAKAGVFAVRQAPVLLANLQRILLHQPLKRYRPQQDFLSLMATGPRHAIASRGSFAARAGLLWQWKNWIDQRFMRKFQDLPPMTVAAPAGKVSQRLLIDSRIDAEALVPGARRCSGCGAKIGADILYRVLERLEVPGRTDLLRGLPDHGSDVPVGHAAGPDAAIIDAGAGLLVQSVDQLRAIVDDPYVFGRIAACHAISDVVTEPVELHSAQVLATLPLAAGALVERDLYQLMAGVVSVLDEGGCALAGGHSAEGTDLQLGLVVNALLDRSVSRSPALQAGDALILTQPLGTGILFAGLMEGRTNGQDLQQALHDMQQLNLAASRCLHDAGARALTDVTGFGLLGHLDNLLHGSGLRARLTIADVPVFHGALALAEAGVHSTLWHQNQAVLPRYDGVASLSLAWQRVLVDPQTSGGLLGVMPSTGVPDCLEALHALGYGSARCIGSLARLPDHQLSLPAGSEPLSASEALPR